jgi:23S rRNA pseudouridine955/2504/2580 synthase
VTAHNDPADVPPVRSVQQLLIDEANAGQRLDNFLAGRLKGAPKNLIFRIIRSGEVRINSKRADASTKLAIGDLVRVPPIRLPEKAEIDAVQQAQHEVKGRDLEVVFEDDCFVAINKPSGLAVHGGSGISFGVIELLRAARPQAKFLELAHRLDRDTSGVLLLAKKRAALVALHEQLRDKSARGQQKTRLDDKEAMRKHYIALVAGVVRDEVRRIRLPLIKTVMSDGQQRVRIAEKHETDALTAQSIVRLSERFMDASLVDVELVTGRTHQIRVHLAAIDHPIIGDDKYGDFKRNRLAAQQGIKRLFLHAAKLQFEHPVKNEQVNIVAQLDTAVSRLRQVMQSGSAQ